MEDNKGNAITLIDAWKMQTENPSNWEFFFDEEVGESEREHLVKFGFQRVGQIAHVIDGKLTKASTLKDAQNKDPVDNPDEDDDSDKDESASKLPDGVEEPLDELGKILQRHVIQFNTDMLWKPLPESRGFPAINKPPHAAFGLQVDIPDRYKELLSPGLKRIVLNSFTDPKAGGGFQKAMFIAEIRKYRIRTVFPCLMSLMKENASIQAEFGNMDGNAAKLITARG